LQKTRATISVSSASTDPVAPQVKLTSSPASRPGTADYAFRVRRGHGERDRSNPPYGLRTWIKKVRPLICALVAVCACDGFPSRSFAQNDPLPPFVNLEFALQVPDFEDSNDIERHGVFSIVLANILTNAFGRAPTDLCAMSAVPDFPDLSIRIKLKEKPSIDQNELSNKDALTRCVRTVENTLTEAIFERDAFDLAVQRAEYDYRALFPGNGDFSRPGQSIYRLPVVGRAALAELYRSDRIVLALLNVYRKIGSMKDAYPSFITWLGRQRQSHRMGFYDLNERTIGTMRRLVALESTPSTRPVLKRAKPLSDEIRVDVPNVRGRSAILVRCATDRRQPCAGAFGLCNQEIGKLVTSSNAEADDARSITRCSMISLLGVGAWIVVECDNETLFRKLMESLTTARMQRPSALDWSLVEYVVWIDTK
jgi:hypothetical protein